MNVAGHDMFRATGRDFNDDGYITKKSNFQGFSDKNSNQSKSPNEVMEPIGADMDNNLQVAVYDESAKKRILHSPSPERATDPSPEMNKSKMSKTNEDSVEEAFNTQDYYNPDP